MSTDLAGDLSTIHLQNTSDFRTRFCPLSPHLKVSDSPELLNTTHCTGQPASFGGEKPDLERVVVLIMTFDGSSSMSPLHHY